MNATSSAQNLEPGARWAAGAQVKARAVERDWSDQGDERAPERGGHDTDARVLDQQWGHDRPARGRAARDPQQLGVAGTSATNSGTAPVLRAENATTNEAR
jgi:hypothetical protein